MPCQTKMCIDRENESNKIYSPWDPPFYDDRYIYHGHRLLHSDAIIHRFLVNPFSVFTSI